MEITKKRYKYDLNVGSRIVELASLGYSIAESAKMLGISRETLYRWIKKYDLLNKMEKAEQDLMKGTIKRGLVALSNGASATEVTEEQVIQNEDGTIIKRTTKTKTLPPNEKAIQILAKKYDKIFSQSELEEVKQLHLSVGVNTSQMTLRELQNVDSPLGVIDVASSDITSTDIPET